MQHYVVAQGLCAQHQPIAIMVDVPAFLGRRQGLLVPFQVRLGQYLKAVVKRRVRPKFCHLTALLNLFSPRPGNSTSATAVITAATNDEQVWVCLLIAPLATSSLRSCSFQQKQVAQPCILTISILQSSGFSSPPLSFVLHVPDILTRCLLLPCLPSVLSAQEARRLQ